MGVYLPCRAGKLWLQTDQESPGSSDVITPSRAPLYCCCNHCVHKPSPRLHFVVVAAARLLLTDQKSLHIPHLDSLFGHYLTALCLIVLMLFLIYTLDRIQHFTTNIAQDKRCCNMTALDVTMYACICLTKFDINSSRVVPPRNPSWEETVCSS